MHKYAQDAMKVIVNDLKSDDKFNIIIFNDGANTWQSEFLVANTENKKRAVDYVNTLRAGGGER